MDAHACVAQAAAAYQVPVAVIERVLAPAQQGGASVPGVGAMRIPPSWLPILERIGFSQRELKHDLCRNILAGTWALAAGGATATPAPRAVPDASARAVPVSVEGLAQRAGVSASCITGAAQFYHLAVPLFAAVLATEAGHTGQIVHNTNGSYDIGPAQVNSAWLPKLARAGISRERLLNDGCTNVAVGAWIMAQSMAGATPSSPADFWQRVGNYNSHTPAFNASYQQKVWVNLERIGGGAS